MSLKRYYFACHVIRKDGSSGFCEYSTLVDGPVTLGVLQHVREQVAKADNVAERQLAVLSWQEVFPEPGETLSLVPGEPVVYVERDAAPSAN